MWSRGVLKPPELNLVFRGTITRVVQVVAEVAIVVHPGINRSSRDSLRDFAGMTLRLEDFFFGFV
jgi:hypothetical protein